MAEKRNIFIEGIQGSGKSTLLQALAQRLPGYNVYREGEISPVELAWCAYMDAGQYRQALEEWPAMEAAIRKKTVQEGVHFITAYTKIPTDDFRFYAYMERYEIYGGRRKLPEMQSIILQRFGRFNRWGNLFECSFFQNIIEELMLFAMSSDEEIMGFYRKIIAALDLSAFKLIRLRPGSIETCIQHIKAERVDEKGEESWYPLMMGYLKSSPFGKAHGLSSFEDLVAHLERRIKLENKIMELLPAACCMELESRRYKIGDIVGALDA